MLLSEEELAAVDQASATAAEVTGSMMRLKLGLEEKKRTVTMLQTALVTLFTCMCEALYIKTKAFFFMFVYMAVIYLKKKSMCSW